MSVNPQHRPHELVLPDDAGRQLGLQRLPGHRPSRTWRSTGKVRSVLLQGPKNGFFYVLDREDGELLRAFPYVGLNWATHVDMATGRPVENPEMAYDKKPQWVMPSNAGGHSWQAMAVDPDRGLAYLPGAGHGGLVWTAGVVCRNPASTNSIPTASAWVSTCALRKAPRRSRRTVGYLKSA